MIVPGNNRRMQMRRKPKRKLFGKKAKEAFLSLLSGNCNVAASADAVGVTPGTVFNHRRTDPEFRDRFWEALEAGTAKLAALRLQREIERAEGKGDGGTQLSPELDGPPDARAIADLYRLLHQLREGARGLSGETKKGRPHDADLDEMCKALAKRLKAFARRCERAEKEAEGRKGGQAAGDAEVGRGHLYTSVPLSEGSVPLPPAGEEGAAPPEGTGQEDPPSPEGRAEERGE